MISVAVVAYAACDMLHEVLGHGLACALIPGVRALSLTTVALQTSAQSRLVAAAHHYLARRRSLPPCRFDAVLIRGEPPRIEWIRNAFGE